MHEIKNSNGKENKKLFFFDFLLCFDESFHSICNNLLFISHMHCVWWLKTNRSFRWFRLSVLLFFFFIFHSEWILQSEQSYTKVNLTFVHKNWNRKSAKYFESKIWINKNKNVNIIYFCWFPRINQQIKQHFSDSNGNW